MGIAGRVAPRPRTGAPDDQGSAAHHPFVRIADFALERYFAKWEFAVEHVACASDVEGWSMSELLELADDEAMPLAPATPEALAWLFYTSGTTGRPKGAMLSHRSLAHMTYSYFLDVDAVPPSGRLLHAAPLSHGSGLYNFTHLARGAAQVIPESGAFDPAEVLVFAASEA